MSTFQFNLTHKCNLNCPFCYSYRNNDIMSNETIDNAIEFVSHRINCESNQNPQIISFSGGEVFLGNWQKITYIIKKIKEQCSEYNLTFIIQSNLTTVDLSLPEFNELIETIDEFGTSFDVGKSRFNSDKTLNQFWKNIEYLVTINKPFELITCLTNDLIKMYPDPMIMFKGVINKGIKRFEIERLCRPLEERPLLKSIKPINKKAKDWLVKAYIAYKEIQKKYNIKVAMFECLEDATKRIYHYEHGRNCQRTIYTILPNGDVGQCFLNIDKPFYNVNTKNLNIDNYEYICQREENVNSNCLKCKYYKYCKGDCCAMEWDESGCPTPNKIFDIIEERNKSNE